MSDTSQGPGWWLASDGKWYPPERHPGYRPSEVPSAVPSNQFPQGGDTPPSYHSPTTSAETALESKGFIRSLYDFSFSSFITLRVIRVLYVLITVVYSLAALFAFVGLLIRHTPGDIALAIIGVPIGYFIYLIVARISLEILMVIFDMGKDVRTIREEGQARVR